MSDALLRRYNEFGMVIVENALPPALLADLRTQYEEALARKVSRFGLEPFRGKDDEDKGYGRPRFRPVGGNHDVNRWNMHLPSRAPFLDPRLITHEAAVPIIESVLGPTAVLALLASDTPFPGSTKQTVHQDATVSRMAVNVSLVDFTEENGPLEYWPGTHCRNPSPDRFDPTPLRWTEEEVKAIADRQEPKRAIVPAGSLMIRDHRILHRGTENRSASPRPMLSLLYFTADDPLPHRSVTDAVAWSASKVRELARQASPAPWAVALLNRANAAGRIAEYLSRSDRDYRRPIPRSEWNRLPPTARHLLRYASIAEDGNGLGPSRSLGASARLLGAAFKGISAAIGGADSRTDSSTES